MIIQSITEGNYYHIYSRGVNSENIFREEINYYYFLQQYKKYCSESFETLAYTLLKNHFHLVVYVRENVFVPQNNGEGLFRLNASTQFSHALNSYAQAFNKLYNRTGPLFESPFERKLIDKDEYLTSMIYYCHYNAELHGMTGDFKQWPHSSYHPIINADNTVVAADTVLSFFGGRISFEHHHRGRYEDSLHYLRINRMNQPPSGPGAADGVLDSVHLQHSGN